ncbi:MAG: GGDEF domain-containing protein [Bradymonadales bacterium]|nr:GGDEF domain-containing protein [Bradymonadales bacterium]
MQRSWQNDHTQNLVRSRLLGVSSILLVVAIGFIDYLTGHQLRVYPLYFLPVSLGSWGRRSVAVVLLALLATALWFGSNYLAGLRFTHLSIWSVNAVAQCAAFTTVGLLISRLSRSLWQERLLARTDPLTQLLNARFFFEAASAELTRSSRYHHPLTLAFVDLDNFKAVNDQLGHQRGDDLLRRVATVMRLSLRNSDLVARMGGDEFALLLLETPPDKAQAALERLIELIGAISEAPQGPKVTASIGAVVCHDTVGPLEDLIRRADILMYKAKNLGKDRLCLETWQQEKEIPGVQNPDEPPWNQAHLPKVEQR